MVQLMTLEDVADIEDRVRCWSALAVEAREHGGAVYNALAEHADKLTAKYQAELDGITGEPEPLVFDIPEDPALATICDGCE